MRSPLPLVDGLTVARPCPADWDAMATTEDGRTRYCDACDKSVHDLSAGTAAEAETLLAAANGKVCVSFLRDREGRVVTRDRRWVRRGLAAAVASWLGLGGTAGSGNTHHRRTSPDADDRRGAAADGPRPSGRRTRCGRGRGLVSETSSIP